jgi:hypothetical protein
MTTPKRLTVRQFRESLCDFRQQVRLGPAGLLRHATCGTPLRSKTVYLSIHDSPFPDSPCAGSGRVDRWKIPFCPACEPEPELYGCLHVPVDMAAITVTVEDPTVRDRLEAFKRWFLDLWT